MTHYTPSPSEQEPALPTRSLRFWLLTIVVPFVLFFAVLGVLSALEKWNLRPPPLRENPQMEDRGLAPWAPKERRADMKRRLTAIETAIPALEGQLKFLDGALKKEQARTQTNPEAKEYVEFIRREQQFLSDRMDELRSDRAYYAHELGEK